MHKPTFFLSIGLAFTAGALAITQIGDTSSKADNMAAEAPTTASSCAVVASQEQAETLLARLFPTASFLAFDELPLDAMKTSCLLEVEMLAEDGKPDTRGFVYVLPDGMQFLNGPLMDKRSRVSISETPADISKAIAEQQQAIKNLFVPGAEQQQHLPPSPKSEVDEIDYSSQLATSFQTPTNPSQVPSVDDMRQRLVEKMTSLPGFTTGEGDKVVHVLVDPQCGYCRKLHEQSNELSAKHGIRFNWIPIFLNEGSWAMSALVLKALDKNPDQAAGLLETMMLGQWGGAEAEAAVRGLTEEDYAAVKPAAGLFLELAKSNSRIGTPLVVFEKTAGGIEVISGLPTENDWQGL